MLAGPLLARRLAEYALLPPTGPLLLALLGLALAGRRPLAGRVLAALGIGVALLSATPWSGRVLSEAVESGVEPLSRERVAALIAQADPPRAVVVLGGGSNWDPREIPGPDTPRSASLQRAVHGARIARWSSLPILVSGGVTVTGRPSEADTLARVIREDLGQPVRWIEGASLDTAGNAQCSAALLQASGIDRVLLVTSATHVRRAVREFEAAGIRTVAAPTAFSGAAGGGQGLDWLPSAEGAALSATAFHELLGMAAHRVRHLWGERGPPTIVQSAACGPAQSTPVEVPR